MKQNRIVVVGGALAGPTAAARAREVDEHAHIVLLERAPNVSYAIGGLAYHLSGEVEDVEALDRERAAFFRANYDVEVRTGVEVHAIDVRARAIETTDGRLAWDALVVSTGAESVVPDVPGLDGALNVVPFRNLVHLRTILRELRRGPRVVVIGGGHFGVEAADGLARRGAEVVLLERDERLLPGFARGASRAARLGLEALGVDVRTSAPIVTASRRGPRVSSLVLQDGSAVPCDVVILAAGVRPRTGLLARAGARLLANGAVRVDERCETSLTDVYACGSCIAVRHAVTDELTWIPQASIVDKSAQVAGASAAGGLAELRPALGTMIVRSGRAVVARTGLAQAAMERAEVTRVHPLSRDAFFPGAAPVSIELAHDPRTGKLLGADVWGTDGVDKRIDVLATAIAGSLTVADLAAVDLAYEPAFSASRDAVNVAGAVATELASEPGIAWSAEEIHGRSGLVLVDLRSAEERAARGAMPGARSLSIAEVRAGIDALAAADGPIVFVSSDGRAGFLAARLARGRGLHDAGFLSGGVASWLAAGFSTESVAARRSKKPRVKAAEKLAKTSSRTRRR